METVLISNLESFQSTKFTNTSENIILLTPGGTTNFFANILKFETTY